MTAFPRLPKRLDAGARILAAGLAAAAMLACAPRALGAEIAMLVPSAVVYPGQAVELRPLEERDFRVKPEQIGDYVLDRQQIAGMLARRTLLPGKPIRLADLKGADVVQAGAPVTLVYREEGLTITGLGTVLQSAVAGEAVRARNTDSGIIVSGVVQADGSVEIGG